MKTINKSQSPINVVVGKDRQRNLYIAIFDSRQESPRVASGSTWVAHDHIRNRRFLMRVVETGYNEDYDLKQILHLVRDNPDQPFDPRALTENGIWENHDQPNVLQTFLKPTTPNDDKAIAAPDFDRGFVVGHLRSGAKVLEPIVTIEDRIVGHRTLISGTSGFGKSTLVRNITRYWIENTNYGKIIDDLKGEFIADIENEQGDTVFGLCHHPDANKNLYLLTSRPRRFEGTDLDEKIAAIIPLNFNIDHIPPDSLSDVGTELTPPQKAFLEMYQEKKGLFSLLLRNTKDGSPYTEDWFKHFNGWIVATKSGRVNIKTEDYTTDLSDFDKSSYTPIFSVRKHLKRLESRPFITVDGKSCLPQLRNLLNRGSTIILDKSGLTDGDKSIISSVIANELYKHNDRFSSGSIEEQKKVIPFVYVVEEAHLLLSREKVKEGSVFVNFAKTGRSFQIGLVAVTQRPSSIDRNILSQFDNYISFRLTNEKDVRDLAEAKSEFQGYEGDIRTMGQGAAVVAFGEPTKFQSIMVFNWTEEKSKSLLSLEQSSLIADMINETEKVKTVSLHKH
jgi:DNA helicase HerA-like ATPase